MNKVDFDEYAASYNTLLREHTGFFTEDESYFARYKVDITRTLVRTAPARVLEFGCGIGRNIPFLREAFPQAIIMGSDVSPASIDAARSTNSEVEFWVEDSTAPDVEPFDLIFVAGVFHHIPPVERTEAMQALSRRLRPGGAAVVFEHNPFNPVTRRIVSQCPYDRGVILLRPRELRDQLERVGLQVRCHAYTLFFPPKLKILAGVERWLQWLPFGGQYWVCADKS